MQTKKKYPKSFRDDGLDDILECVDEILAGSSNQLKRNDDDRKKSNKKDKKEQTKVKLYGDNNITNEKYKPPKRLKLEVEEQELNHEEFNKTVGENLVKRTRGLINKLAAQTMPFITSEFEKLYSTNHRASVDLALFDNIETSIIRKEAIVKRKLIAELMLLVSYLNSKISLDIGASLVHRLVKKLEHFITNYDNEDEKDMRSNNVLCCLINLYVINLISSNVVFEVTKRVCSSKSRVKSVELLLLVLKNVSLQLRKDNPKTISRLISVINEKNFKSIVTDEKVDFRVKHMVKDLEEILLAVKNNNINKISNYGCDVDNDTIESTLKSLIHRTKLTECLSDATYEEILNSPNWYLLETRLNEGPEIEKQKTNEIADNLSGKKEIKICKALGLNKPTERTIFGALLRSTDYVEASNNIIGFGLNHCSDAMLVCIHVAIHEKKYNIFYYNLIHTLCKFNRKYKLSTKFSIQDKIRNLGNMNIKRVEIFKRLCYELIKSDAIPITILKAIEWADISSSTKEFLEYLLENISQLPSEDRKKIMMKVDRKSSFAAAMRAFIECFMEDCKLFH